MRYKTDRSLRRQEDKIEEMIKIGNVETWPHVILYFSPLNVYVPEMQSLLQNFFLIRVDHFQKGEVALQDFYRIR